MDTIEEDPPRSRTPDTADAVLGLPGWAKLLLFNCIVWLWRSYWNLLDIYIYPSNFAISNWITLLMGIAGVVFLRWKFGIAQMYKWLQ
jgi:hypothetical protein